MSVRPSPRSSKRPRGIALFISAVLVAGLVASVTVAQAAPQPLTVTVTPSSNPVASGTSFTWTINVVNDEPDDVETVRMTDQLTGLKNIVLTSSRGVCTESSLLVTCEAGTMSHNTTWVVTIRGIVTATNGEVLSNTATVNGRKGGQDFAVPATSQVLVNNAPSSPLADLSSSISGPSSVAPGGSALYRLAVNNAGGSNATDVMVSATVPGGFTLGSVQGSNLFDCSASATPTVTCVGGEINDGGNAVIDIQTTASNTLGTHQLTGVVDPENRVAESNEENNTSSYAVTIPSGPSPTEPITFTKTAASPVDKQDCNPCGTQIRPGDLMTYTITTTNTSPKSSASKLHITDGTQGLELASVKATSSDPKLVCTPSTSEVVCRANNNNYILGAGQSVVVTITGTVVQNPSSVITNTATLQTLQNRISITRRASVSTTVRPGIDLSVTQYSTCSDPQRSLLPCPPFRARNQFDYLITVGNSGLNDATGVVVREPLPNGVIFEGFSNLGFSNWSCAVDAENVVTCTGGTVPGQLSTSSHQGTIRQLRLHLTAPNSIGPITSTAYVDPYNALKESDSTNNTVTTTTPIATGIDLTTMQAVNFKKVAPSGTLVYDVLIQNIGTQDAGAIRLSDVVPAGARFRSAKEVPNPFGSPYTPPHGFTCSFEETTEDVVCSDGRLLGIYAAYGGPPLQLAGTPDNVTIRITLFAPAPFGPEDSLTATGSPILNQVMADPAGNIPEISDANNLNILETNVGIPPTNGDWGTYHELTVDNRQTNPMTGSVAPNGTLEYTLTVSNWGSDPVSNVTVYDYIPQGARFRDARAAGLVNGTGGFQCSFNAGLVSCGNGALAAAPSVGTPRSTDIRIKLFAPDTPNDETSQYTNHSVVDPLNAVPEANETNNVSDEPLTVEVGGQNAYNQLIISVDQFAPTTTSPGPAVAPSGTLGYRLTIGNTGSDVAQQVIVRDFLPEGARFRSARNNATLSSTGSGGFACFHQNGVVECSNGTIQGGGMAVIDILMFAPAQPGTVDNQAVVDPKNEIPEGNEQDNAASKETTVDLGGANAFIDLVISKLESDPASVATDTAMKYKLEVKNEGTDRAFNVKLSDYLPVGTRFVSGVDDAPGDDAFTCREAGGVVDCTGGSIPGGGTRNVTIVVRSPRHSDVTLVDNKTQITNEALIDPDNAIPEGDERNNSAYVTTTVLANVDLTAANEGSACGGQSGNECNWTFDVTNSGPDAVTDVMVRTDLPIGVIPLDVTAPADWACTTNENPINSVTCVRQAPLTASTPQSFSIRVYVTANSGNSISSTTVVDPNDTIVESDEVNNTKSDTESA